MPASVLRPLVRPGTDTDAVAGVVPRLVAEPASTDDVSRVMKDAAAQGHSVVVRGNGSKSTWGVPPSSLDLLVDLSRMNRVLEHEAGDLIVSAQAGTPLADLQEALAPAGQRLGVDDVVPRTTIGGLIATNVSGPRRVALGTVRDLVIGVTVVRADGVVAKAGGKVVKNVAGYDLSKLMVGSFGTLGVVTEATFRLHPVPEASTWLTVEAESPSAASDLIASVVHSQVVPAAVEVDAVPGAPTRLSVLLEGTERGVAQRSERVRDLLGTTTTYDVPLALPGHADGARTLLKLTTQISSAPEIAQAAVDLGFHVRGSVGVGVLYASTGEAARASAAVGTLRTLTGRSGGAAVVLDAPTDVRDVVDMWGPVQGLDLMRRVKHEFDPDNRLAPGRFVGGI
ncbi:FAD-binding oxidoreductase [Luteipulveratus halotolerans]|uniref:FAD-binding PCMH-type domain-containing protein n=1 Tax=Luteipulveratus halotolerans TaxID=1631356 RepID=A0A0L6CID7_9MICO|nr:FAD-binding oxidoreductase [Luteipulveratus halotolerans]KNX37474.1 hypothetical protein VV01_10470 [Luteipulveratus halotolerans]